MSISIKIAAAQTVGLLQLFLVSKYIESTLEIKYKLVHEINTAAHDQWTAACYLRMASKLPKTNRFMQCKSSVTMLLVPLDYISSLTIDIHRCEK